MPHWTRNIAKAGADAADSASRRIADMAARVANQQMSRREFLSKVGALAGATTLKGVPVPDALPASIAPIAEAFSPGSFLPEAFRKGFNHLAEDGEEHYLVGAITGFRPRGQRPMMSVDAEDWTDGLRRDERKPWDRIPNKEAIQKLVRTAKAAEGSLSSMPEGVPVAFNHLTNQWHARLPTAVHERTLVNAKGPPSDPVPKIYYGVNEQWMAGNQGPPEWMTRSDAPEGSLAAVFQKPGRYLPRAGQDWNQESSAGDVLRWWGQRKASAAEYLHNQARQRQLDPDEQSQLREHLLDLERPAGGRPTDAPPAMQPHPLGMEAMGLPGAATRDDHARVRRLLGIAAPVAAGAAGSQQEQPSFLDGLRTN